MKEVVVRANWIGKDYRAWRWAEASPLEDKRRACGRPASPAFLGLNGYKESPAEILSWLGTKCLTSSSCLVRTCSSWYVWVKQLDQKWSSKLGSAAQTATRWALWIVLRSRIPRCWVALPLTSTLLVWSCRLWPRLSNNNVCSSKVKRVKVKYSQHIQTYALGNACEL